MVKVGWGGVGWDGVGWCEAVTIPFWSSSRRVNVWEQQQAVIHPLPRLTLERISGPEASLVIQITYKVWSLLQIYGGWPPQAQIPLQSTVRAYVMDPGQMVDLTTFTPDRSWVTRQLKQASLHVGHEEGQDWREVALFCFLFVDKTLTKNQLYWDIITRP